jgi:hypothetical protein
MTEEGGSQWWSTSPSLRAIGTNRHVGRQYFETLAGAWAGGTDYRVNFVLLNKFVCFVFCVTLLPFVIFCCVYCVIVFPIIPP